MRFEVEIIKALQKMSCGFMDWLNQAFSFFGTETFFLIVAVFIFWCLDKRFGYKFLNVYILGLAVTNVMKICFKRIRPFSAYPEEVRSIGKEETFNTSFPSGHTQSISSIAALTTIGYGKKYKAVPIVGAILVILVMLSRQYLGMHYLSDVFGGLTVGVFTSITFYAMFSLFKDKEEWFVIPAVVMSVVLIAVFGGMGMLSQEEGAAADLLKGIGAFSAFNIGYFIEKKWVRYDVKARRKWWTVLLRVVIGGGVTVAVQQLFKLFLPKSIPMLYCFLRYFLMAAWASVVAPLCFKAVKI